MSKTRRYITRRPARTDNREIRPENDACPYCHAQSGVKESANAFADYVFVHMRCKACNRQYSVVTR